VTLHPPSHSVGPLVEQSLFLDPSIVVTAFLGATAIFACFTAAALFSKKRSLLYLGGILGSALTIMLVLSLANIFIGSVMFMYAELYVGLLIFCAYVAFDTQAGCTCMVVLCMHRCERGHYLLEMPLVA